MTDIQAFEILNDVKDAQNSYKLRTHLQEPFSFACYIKCSFNDALSRLEVFRGPDCAKTAAAGSRYKRNL